MEEDLYLRLRTTGADHPVFDRLLRSPVALESLGKAYFDRLGRSNHRSATEGDRVQLVIPEVWRDRLRDVRQVQLPHWSNYILPVETAMGTEVVLLQYGYGTASLLGLDGRVYVFGEHDQPPRRTDQGPWVAGLLVWASHAQPGMPDLSELLPPPDADGIACPWCEGRRWFVKPEEEWPGGWVCMLCRGLGWVDKARLRGTVFDPAKHDAEPSATADGGA